MDSKQNNQPSIFGRSLQLLKGDLSFVENDLAMIEGRGNFMQGMKVMIETPFGTDIFNINYGFDLLNSISQPQTVSVIKQLIRLNIVKSLSFDDRVSQVKEIVFDDEARFYELNLDQDFDENREIRKTSRRWQATVIVQTISEESEVALTIEGAGV